jgi:hypothetical protein
VWVYMKTRLWLWDALKTHVYHNKAGTPGGGLHLLSANFDPAQLTGLVMVYSNSAHYSGDIVISATSTTVVDCGDADSVIASASKDTTLVLTLSVSGPHGWPSEEFIWVSLSTFANEVLGTFTANTTTSASTGLRRQAGSNNQHVSVCLGCLSLDCANFPGRLTCRASWCWGD